MVLKDNFARLKKSLKNFIDQNSTLNLSLTSVGFEIFILKKNLLKRILKVPSEKYKKASFGLIDLVKALRIDKG